MRLDPLALAEALRSEADALHREMIGLPVPEQVSSGIMADINKLREAAACIERREHQRELGRT